MVAVVVVIVLVEVVASVSWLLAPGGSTVPVRGEALPLRVVGDPVDTPWLGLGVRKHTHRRIERLVHVTIVSAIATAMIETHTGQRTVPRAVRETMLRRTLDAAWVAANDLAGTPVATKVHALVAANPVLDSYTMIVAADGDDTDVFAALRRAATHGPETVVLLTLESPRGEPLSRSITVGALGDLGALNRWRVAVAPPPPIDLPPNVRGGSIGLSAALLYVDRVTPGDLSGGSLVAASGTIDPDGTVGRVASLPWKLDAAARAGAATVLVPTVNADDLDVLPERSGATALHAGSVHDGSPGNGSLGNGTLGAGPLVLAVATLSDAVAALCRGGSQAACTVAGAASP
jgi:hypothetical protein